MEVQVAVLAERVEQSQLRTDKRHDSIEKKLDDALSKYTTQEQHEGLKSRVEKLESFFGWLWKSVGAFLLLGILTAVFKSGVFHS